MCQHLVAPVSPGGDDRVRTVKQPGQHASPRLRRVTIDAARDVHLRHAVRGQFGGGGDVAEHDGIETARTGCKPAGQCQRSQGSLDNGAVVDLYQAEHVHESTPRSARTETRAGTASAPWPSTTASRPETTGTRSLVVRRPSSGTKVTGTRVITARLARSRPGSDG